MKNSYTLSDFDYALDPDLIATRPVSPRDHARLLVVQPQELFDRHVYDLPDLLRAGDLLVFNDTRVIPARLIGKLGLKTFEVLLHKKQGLGLWQAFVKGSKKIKSGDVLTFAPDFDARIVQKDLADGMVMLQFSMDDADFYEKLNAAGTMPVPPYFKRLGDVRDQHDYQTLFAKHDGAVAAPTAGLHFTEELMTQLGASGIGECRITLHVGAGTFSPVRSENIAEHRMHAENFVITDQSAAMINAARKNGGRIVAVGTTVLRSLEAASDADGLMHASSGETDIFITPGYRFRAVDVLLTNFHLPKSTLLMLVAAFSGLDRIRAAYTHANAKQYRFYSYGDACLLYPQKL